MKKALETLLLTTLTILIVGVVLTTLSLSLNENEIGLMFASVTSYTCLPLLIISIIIDVKLRN
jgi:hypothetical protein